MKSKRLQALCEFLTPQDRIIDIGTDHAYVPIEMAKRGAKNLLATDIHLAALKIAQQNIQEAHLEEVIQTQLADGLWQVPVQDHDTLVIAGMGFSTIQHILANPEKLQTIQKIVVQSNNDWSSLRTFMEQIGYALKREKKIYEKGHYYLLMKYEKGRSHLTEEEILFGLYSEEDQAYYQNLLHHYEEVLQQIPKSSKDYDLYEKLSQQLKDYIKRKN